LRHSGIAIVVAAALGLTACGSNGPSKSAATTTPVPSGRSVVLASVVKTAASDSAKLSLDLSFNGPGSGAISGEGVVDFANGNSQLTMEFGGALGTIMPSGIETRTVDGVAYVHLPVGLPSGKEWVSVDTTQLGDVGSSGGSSALGIGGGASPTKILAYLEKVSNGVEKVGTETVRGVETTHYRANVDLTKAVDKEGVPRALHDAMDEIADAVGTIPVDVFIDGDGLLRREQLAMDFASFLPGGSRRSSGATDGAPTITMTLDLYDFGTPVDVEAPPADQVVTAGNGEFAEGGAFGSQDAA
jgi:hypothetical protein